MEKETGKFKAPWWQPSLLLFGKLSGWTAGPVVVAVFLGKWLDKKYGTAPWLFLLSVCVAFIISSVGIIKESKDVMAKIAKEGRKPDNDKLLKK